MSVPELGTGRQPAPFGGLSQVERKSVGTKLFAQRRRDSRHERFGQDRCDSKALEGGIEDRFEFGPTLISILGQIPGLFLLP